MELSRRAGFSINYVRMIEKGIFSPQPDAVEKLAEALELTGEERTAFFRSYDSSRTPKTIRDAAGREPVPGLALWSWLPPLLWAVPHREVTPLYADPDQVLIDVVRSAASLLSWVALADRGPTARHKSQLLKLQADAQAAAPTVTPRIVVSGGVFIEDEPDPEAFVWVALPRYWRQILLGSERTARDLVGRLARWDYQPPTKAAPLRRALSFDFKDAQLQSRYGVRCIAPRDVATLHDAMVTWRLLEALDWNNPLSLPVLHGSRIGERVRLFLKADDAELQRRLTLPDPAPAAQGVGEFIRRINVWARRANFARFASRVFDCKLAADDLFRENRDTVKQRIGARLALLEGLLTSAGQAARQANKARRQAMLAEHERRMQDPPPDADAPPENPDQAAAGDQATP